MREMGRSTGAVWVLVCLLLAPSISQAAPSEPLAVLAKSSWEHGLPGFPENAFEALYGEYRLERVPGAPVRVWATTESLFLKGWSRRTMAGMPFLERGGLLLWERQGGSPWTILVSPPTTLPSEELARFLKAFIPRFSYFASASGNPFDVSLPAVLFN